MSARKTIHHRNIGHTQTACGFRGLAKQRCTHIDRMITCNRCRKSRGLGQLWAPVAVKRTKGSGPKVGDKVYKGGVEVGTIIATSGPRKPPKRVTIPAPKRKPRAKHSDLVALDEKTMQEVRDADVRRALGPNADEMLRTMLGESGSRAIKALIAETIKDAPALPSSFHEAMVKAVGKPLALRMLGVSAGDFDPKDMQTFYNNLIPVPKAVPSPHYMTRLEAVYSFASELCDAIDAAEEDVGGSRPMKEILGDLGTAVGYVDDFKREAKSKQVRDENAG